MKVGQSRTVRHATYAEDGTPASAAQCVLTVTNPLGANLAVVLDGTAPDTGIFAHSIKFDMAGLWRWSWDSGGAPAVDGAETGAVWVEGLNAAITGPWCSAADASRSSALRKLREARTIDMGELERCCFAATEWLQSRTKGRFKGLHIATLRPCCACHASVQAWSQMWAWVAWGAHGDVSHVDDWPTTCSCHILPEVRLPGSMPNDPAAVLAVTIDGVSFTDWRLDPGRLLVRTDGERWPCCQDMTLDATETNTFAVTCVLGDATFEVARLAAIDLASEFYLYQSDPSQCRIPTKVTTVTRQGSTYQTVNTATFGADGTLGLRLVDIFLAEFGKARKTMRMRSPDVAGNARAVR